MPGSFVHLHHHPPVALTNENNNPNVKKNTVFLGHFKYKLVCFVGK